MDGNVRVPPHAGVRHQACCGRHVGRDPQRPNRFILLLWIGVAVLTAALITAGIGLIAGGIAAL